MHMSETTEKKHARVAKRAEDISMTFGIISTVISIAASQLEPSGLSALAVFVGISDPPLVVTLAPIIVNVATAAALFSGVVIFPPMGAPARRP